MDVGIIQGPGSLFQDSGFQGSGLQASGFQGSVLIKYEGA